MTSRSEVGPRAGVTSDITLALRDRPSLTTPQRTKARKLRRAGASMQQIADLLDVPLLSVSHALANLRTPRANPPRATLNVSLAALDHVRARQLPGEAIWETMNRLLGV
jgi:hypothetical protein